MALGAALGYRAVNGGVKSLWLGGRFRCLIERA
jgi:hypothetical protein